MAQTRRAVGYAGARAARPSDPVLTPHPTSGGARISAADRAFHRGCIELAHRAATHNPEGIKRADADRAKPFPRCFTRVVPSDPDSDDHDQTTTGDARRDFRPIL